MKSFSMGISYLRAEALKSGFIIESDNDDKLLERLSQVVRKLGPEDAERCDELSAKGKEKAEESEEEVESGSDQKPKRKT